MLWIWKNNSDVMLSTPVWLQSKLRWHCYILIVTKIKIIIMEPVKSNQTASSSVGHQLTKWYTWSNKEDSVVLSQNILSLFLSLSVSLSIVYFIIILSKRALLNLSIILTLIYLLQIQHIINSITHNYASTSQKFNVRHTFQLLFFILRVLVSNDKFILKFQVYSRSLGVNLQKLCVYSQK